MATPAKLSHIAISNILLATDFSPESQNALQCALSLARRYRTKLFLAHATPSLWVELTDLTDAKRHEGEVKMAQLESPEGLKNLPHKTIVETGEPWQVLSHLVREENVDFVVMGTHGAGGMNKLFVGSTAEQVIRHATCPVFTVGPHVRTLVSDRFASILYATDFSEGSMRALDYALSFAEEDRSEMTMLHVIESTPVSESELVEWKRQDRDKLKQMIPPDLDLAYKPEIEVEVGAAAQEIVRLADSRDTDLVVMGCHSGGAVSTHLPWTTLHHVLQHTHCPVLTVRGTLH